ncbi:MAG: formylglycine-generating enzyme family protein [Chloroflexi bacterium]|nr:formylglycine-generating enzyme family protein [Chloroflexota bacterium]
MCMAARVRFSNQTDTMTRPLIFRGQKVEDARDAYLVTQALIGTTDRPQTKDKGCVSVECMQRWFVHLIETNALPANERILIGDILATLGDTRFDPTTYYLPKDKTWGFVEIPAGKFIMGTRQEDIPALMKKFGGDVNLYESETPQHLVDLPRYFIARYLVTGAQFKHFVKVSHYKPDDKDSLREPDNCPACYVTWRDAIAYCDWLTTTLKKEQKTPEPLASLLQKEQWRITLPNEPQWEKAARTTDGRLFAWGDEFDSDKANIDSNINTTSAVGCFPKGTNHYGLQDMTGNVWEWTRSVYANYPYNLKDKKREDLKAKNVARVLRGGAFGNNKRYARCAYRLRLSPDGRSKYYGFRVVASPF